MKKLAIDMLRESNGRADLVEKAVRIHMECDCGGGGASSYYPEDPCPKCGFNFADSFGVEKIIEMLEERDNGKGHL